MRCFRAGMVLAAAFWVGAGMAASAAEFVSDPEDPLFRELAEPLTKGDTK